MEPLSTSTPVTVPIVAACREVSTTVSVRRASRERRRRVAKGWRSTSASRRPGFARASCSVSRASCSVSRSSTSAGGKGACLNGAAAAAAAMHTALASIDGKRLAEGGRERTIRQILQQIDSTGEHALTSTCIPYSDLAPLHARFPNIHPPQPLRLGRPHGACCELGAAAGRGGGAHACCPALRGGAAVSARAAPQGRRGQGRGRVARRAYREPRCYTRLGTELGGGLGGGRRRVARKRAT